MIQSTYIRTTMSTFFLLKNKILKKTFALKKTFISVFLLMVVFFFLTPFFTSTTKNCHLAHIVYANTPTQKKELSKEQQIEQERLAAQKKQAEAEAELESYYASLLKIKILETENHNLFLEFPEKFIKIPHKTQLFFDVQKQLPAEAYLLDVFIPANYEQDLNRDFFGNITKMLYLYTMPYILEENERIQKFQLNFIKKSLLSVLNFFEPLSALKNEAADTKLIWETKVYERLMRGQSIHFRYPTHKAKNGEDEILSMLQTYPLDTVRNIGTKSSEAVDGTGYKYTGAFMSTYMFERNQQVYFLSASSFITDNHYYEELMWTRNTIEDFIQKIIPRPVKVR